MKKRIRNKILNGKSWYLRDKYRFPLLPEKEETITQEITGVITREEKGYSAMVELEGATIFTQATSIHQLKKYVKYLVLDFFKHGDIMFPVRVVYKFE